MFDTRTRLLFLACLKDAAGAALKNAALAPSSDQQKIDSGSGATLTVAAPQHCFDAQMYLQYVQISDADPYELLYESGSRNPHRSGSKEKTSKSNFLPKSKKTKQFIPHIRKVRNYKNLPHRSWIQIRISPYGSGSRLLRIRIRVNGSGSASLVQTQIVFMGVGVCFFPRWNKLAWLNMKPHFSSG